MHDYKKLEQNNITAVIIIIPKSHKRNSLLEEWLLQMITLVKNLLFKKYMVGCPNTFDFVVCVDKLLFVYSIQGCGRSRATCKSFIKDCYFS